MNRLSRYLLSFLILITACTLFPACSDDGPQEEAVAVNPFRKAADGPALNVAHRGGRDLAPENTLVAFANAVQLGVDVLEMDVLLTADGVLVTNHDLTIDRTSDGAGSLYEYTFDELQAFNFGYHFRAPDGSYPYRDNPVRIPRVEEIFEQFGDQYMIIELKNPPPTGKRAAERIVELIVEYGLTDRVCVFSFNTEIMERFHYLNREIGIYPGASILEAVDFIAAIADGDDSDVSIKSKVFAFPQEVEGIPLATDSDFIVEGAHRHNIALHYWTINDKPTMKELILKGADGIITDRPDLMQEALQELGF